MASTRLLLFLIQSLMGISLIAQAVDHAMGPLAVVSGEQWHGGPTDGAARMQALSDGKHLNLFIEVKDDVVITNAPGRHADRLELTLALPRSLYPRLFPHHFHPYYFHHKGQATRGKLPGDRHRFFSLVEKDFGQLKQDLLQEAVPYPSVEEILRDTLWVPPPNQLDLKRIDFGLVQYALYPDGRPAQLLNTGYFSELEANLQVRMGDIAAGLIYTVDKRPDGYNFNIQIAPQGLGFVTAPSMDKVALAIDFFDYDVPRGLATVHSTAASLPASRSQARDLEEFSLQKPLETNFGQTPNRIFQLTRFAPLQLFTEEGWIPVNVDCEYLVVRPFEIRDEITEVQFFRDPFRFEAWKEPGSGVVVEQLRITRNFIHEVPRVEEYTLVSDKVMQTSRNLNQVQVLDTGFHTRAFAFPDGGTGLICVNNHTRHPRGWGECGTCIEEEITIFRATPTGFKKIAQVRQGDDPAPFFSFRGIQLDGFRADRLDWADPGRILVFQLTNTQSGQRKRIRLSWDARGEKVVAQVLP